MRTCLAALSLASTPALAQGGAFAQACQATPSFSENFTSKLSAQWTPIVHPVVVNANREMQAYRRDAIATGPDGLQLTATRQGTGYASGEIASTASFRYGCFDIVASMPEGRGLWPALWLRTAYAQPIDGEIDIMEGFGSHPGLFQSTLHQWAHGVHHGFACARIGAAASSWFGASSICHWQPRLWSTDFTQAPHHYGLIWTPRAITWLIDGRPYYTLRSGVPDRAMAIQLDLAVGGSFDGNPDATTGFPAVMTVRSVTVWPLR